MGYINKDISKGDISKFP
jgi:hypothetical protein